MNQELNYNPLVSLVICTYNRSRFLPETLESLKTQTASRSDFEVIVVDNNSTDNTKAIVLEFIRDNLQINIRYCFEANKGLSFARNRGIRETASAIITYVDDDAILTPGFISNIIDFFDKIPHAMGAGGRVIPKFESGQAPVWDSKYVSAMSGAVDHGTEIKKYTPKMKYPAGCNMTYKKSLLLTAGGFNNELTFRSDDKFIFHQVKKYTDEIYYLPNVVLHHYIDDERLEFKNFRKLYLKSGNEEKKRIRSEGSFLKLIIKTVELTIKLAAACLLFLLFTIKGEVIKGKYIFLAIWFTFVGFLKRDIFVR